MKYHSFSSPLKRGEFWAGLALIAVHGILLPVIINLVYPLFETPPTMGQINVAYYAASFALILIFMHRFLRAEFSNLVDNLAVTATSVILGYFAAVAMSYLIDFIIYFLSPEGITNPNNEAVLEVARISGNQAIVVSVLLGPIVEETLFRGVVFGATRRKSRIAAYAVSTVVFAFYHVWSYVLSGGFTLDILLSMLQYVPHSIALAWCYERCGSLWGPIVLHAAMNLITVTTYLNI